MVAYMHAVYGSQTRISFTLTSSENKAKKYTKKKVSKLGSDELVAILNICVQSQ